MTRGENIILIILAFFLVLGCCLPEPEHEEQDEHYRCLESGRIWITIGNPDAGVAYCSDGRSGLVQVERVP